MGSQKHSDLVQQLAQILYFFYVEVVLAPVFLQVLGPLQHAFVVSVLVTHLVHHGLELHLLLLAALLLLQLNNPGLQLLDVGAQVANNLLLLADVLMGGLAHVGDLILDLVEGVVLLLDDLGFLHFLLGQLGLQFLPDPVQVVDHTQQMPVLLG